MKRYMGITAWLWNPLIDLRVWWLIYKFKNICAGILSLFLDLNKMLWKFITIYDDTDMHNWVTYRTNLENWIFKIVSMENRTISPRIKIWIIDLIG